MLRKDIFLVMTDYTIARKLALEGVAIREQDIQASSYAAASRLLLDALGCAIAGYAQPGIEGVRRQMLEWGGKGEAGVLLSSERIPLPNAVFVNSAMVHALDYDDVYLPATLHLTSTLIPVVLGLGEKATCSGRKVLAALILGIEAAARLGIAEREHRRGGAFLPSSLLNGFGAVIAAARLSELSVDQCVHAMGLNYAQVSGNRQALLDMTLAKRLQPAFAARSAMWAVSLAQQGITGPQCIFEGEAGYSQTYLNGETLDPALCTMDVDELQVEYVSIKRYPSCGACHNVQIAAERVKVGNSLSAGDIDRVEIFNCGPGGLVSEPFVPGKTPQVSAQFSVIWAVAHTFVHGPASLDDYTDERVASDGEVIDFCRRISFAPAPDDLPVQRACLPLFPTYNMRYQGVIVHTHDGRRFMGAQCPFDTFDPTKQTMEQVQKKFRECVLFAGLEGKLSASAIIEAVCNLEDEPCLDNLRHELKMV